MFAFLAWWSFIPPPLTAQTLPDGWSPIFKSANSDKWVSINLNTIKVVGTPASVISLTIFDPSVGTPGSMELHCADDRINDRGIWRSLSTDQPTSIRRLLFNSFCRFSHEGKRWRVIGGNLNPTTKEQTGIVMVNMDSKRRVESPFSGVGVDFVLAGWDKEGTFILGGAGDIIFDCNDRARSANKYGSSSDYHVITDSAQNTMFHSGNMMVCALSVSGTSEPAQKPVVGGERGGDSSERSIGNASKTCSDLGFKKGSEKFGDCVLRLSK